MEHLSETCLGKENSELVSSMAEAKGPAAKLARLENGPRSPALLRPSCPGWSKTDPALRAVRPPNCRAWSRTAAPWDALAWAATEPNSPGSRTSPATTCSSLATREEALGTHSSTLMVSC
ncbi:hypothetical protein WMY93_025847 [Mugilogobius chulae]|uniref:Uncharacterized protein n=1 Tax=Mugilogobius chulae TaxID=88201 RepID=A0AAW0N637_9GOBI